MKNNPDFLIIDTYNMIGRSKLVWTKVPEKDFVILSFLRMFYKTIEYFNPTKIIMPFDDYIGNSFRRKINPEYKNHRYEKHKKDPFNESFKRQKEIILDLLENDFPVYTLKYKGYEADDLIAMICKITSDDVKINVWSNDKDLIQLQQKIPNVKIWDPRSKDFFKNPGFDIVSYKSLVGDRSDNIRGVGRIGDKTASKVMNSQLEFINLVASHPKRYIKFRQNKKIIDLLDNDLPIPRNLDYILSKKVKFNPDRVEEIIDKNNFRSLKNNFYTFKSIFFKTALKNNSNKREWFFNRGNVNG